MQEAECWIEDRGNRKQDTGYKNSDKYRIGYSKQDRSTDHSHTERDGHRETMS
jgi:hypothetical protein